MSCEKANKLFWCKTGLVGRSSCRRISAKVSQKDVSEERFYESINRTIVAGLKNSGGAFCLSLSLAHARTHKHTHTLSLTRTPLSHSLNALLSLFVTFVSFVFSPTLFFSLKVLNIPHTQKLSKVVVYRVFFVYMSNNKNTLSLTSEWFCFSHNLSLSLFFSSLSLDRQMHLVKVR